MTKNEPHKPVDHYFTIIVSRKIPVFSGKGKDRVCLYHKLCESISFVVHCVDYAGTDRDMLKTYYEMKHKEEMRRSKINGHVNVFDASKSAYASYIRRGRDLQRLVEGPVRASEA